MVAQVSSRLNGSALSEAALATVDSSAAGACGLNLGRGLARLSFRQRQGATVLAGLYQKDPLRVMFPRVAADDAPTAVLITTSGGLVGGDTLDVEVDVGAESRVTVTTQAAEKVYRSAGRACRVDQSLSAEGGAWLEWLPQETILFDGARLQRRTRVHLEHSACFLGGEILVFGRGARGESLTKGQVLDRWEVFLGGRLAWFDVLRLDENVGALLANPACFGGARAFATVVYAAADAGKRLELARTLLPQDGGGALRAAASCVADVLIVRWLGPNAFDLRQAYACFLSAFRAETAGLPRRLPRVWEI